MIMLLCCPDTTISWEPQLMLISHMKLSLVHSCCTKGLPLGVDYVTSPAAGVPEERAGGEGNPLWCQQPWVWNPKLLLCRTFLLHVWHWGRDGVCVFACVFVKNTISIKYVLQNVHIILCTLRNNPNTCVIGSLSLFFLTLSLSVRDCTIAQHNKLLFMNPVLPFWC